MNCVYTTSRNIYIAEQTTSHVTATVKYSVRVSIRDDKFILHIGNADVLPWVNEL